jgi:hypothetical protein
MASWGEIESEVPEFAARARALLTAHTHLTLATLRRDGSPRISGIEINLGDGEAYLGSMWQAVKALDLQRDPRFALHSGTGDAESWSGDAKLAGTAEEITDRNRVGEVNRGAGARSHLFRLEITELVIAGLNDTRTKMMIESWHEGRGLSRMER